jgi:hypothetical protein
LLHDWADHVPPPHEPADENDVGFMGVWKMGHGKGTQNASISDGTSNTLMVSEVLGYRSNRDGRGAWTTNIPGGSLFMARTGPNSDEGDVTSFCEPKIPNTDRMKCSQNRTDGAMWAAARSRHPGGVVASHCDGSVKFYEDGIDLQIWRALATRAGNDDSTGL